MPRQEKERRRQEKGMSSEISLSEQVLIKNEGDKDARNCLGIRKNDVTLLRIVNYTQYRNKWRKVLVIKNIDRHE